MDRGIDYRELIEYLSQSQVPHIILMEATGKRIFEEIAADYPDFENPSRLLLAEHLKDACLSCQEGYKAWPQLCYVACSCQLRHIPEF